MVIIWRQTNDTQVSYSRVYDDIKILFYAGGKMMAQKVRAYIKDLDKLDHNDIPHKGHFVYGQLLNGNYDSNIDAIVGSSIELDGLIEVNGKYVNANWLQPIEKGSAEQFTGLKDANGDDIYENDLVSLDPDDPPYQVIYDEGKFKLSNDYLGLVYDLGEKHINCEIVGNIHTRPKTIRGKMMKIKTFWTDCTEDDEFDSIVNKFIEGKKVVQISTGDTILPYDNRSHTLTVLYEDTENGDTSADTRDGSFGGTDEGNYSKVVQELLKAHQEGQKVRLNGRLSQEDIRDLEGLGYLVKHEFNLDKNIYNNFWLTKAGTSD